MLLGLARLVRRQECTEPGLRTCLPRLEANPQAGGTVRPNTSLLGWPAGALRRRVTYAIRSVCCVVLDPGESAAVPSASERLLALSAAQKTASKSGLK